MKTKGQNNFFDSRGKFFLILGILFLGGIVSADIISVNSGGSESILINPNQYIEGFFFMENRAPVVDSVILNSTFGTNLTSEDLTVYYSTSDPDNNYITNITDWRVDGKSVAIVNFPFDTLTEGVTRDYSTNEFNGTLGATVGHVPSWRSGCVVGGCYDFDGETDSIYGNYQISNTGADGITAGAWVYMKNSDVNTYATVFTIGVQSPTVGYHWLLINDQIGTVYWQYSNGTNFRSVSRALAIPQETWTHVAVSHNYTSGEVKFYKNGNFAGIVYTTDPVIPISSKPFKIGTYSSQTAHELNGSLDELFIFNKTLSPNEINQIYSDNLNGKHLDKMLSFETSVGETWQVAVTASDGRLESETVLSNPLTIENDPPINPSPVLVSVDGTNESDSDLNCSSFIYDSDSSSLSVFVNWIRDGEVQFTSEYGPYSNNSLFSGILESGNLTLGDLWTCEVRVYDGYDYSDWILSNEVEIIDITSPEVYIISPEPINYSTVEVPFNISIVENENVSMCFYDLDFAGNLTMNEINDSYFWILDNTIGPGYHEVWFYCNDTSNNWGSNFTNFTVDNEAAISILMSEDLLWGVKWNVLTLPIDDLDAVGNNFNSSTSYFLNVSAVNTYVDLYMKADGDLFNDALDSLGLSNETYAVSLNDSTVSDLTRNIMTTDFVLIAENLGDNSSVYLKFYLDAPANQPAGIYLNNLEFKAVKHGQGI